MPVSQSQRLKKRAAKANKRKAVVAEKLAQTRRELAISKPRHVDVAASPLADCLMTERPEDEGMAMVLLSRKLSLGRFAVASFLVDSWCLGIKGAFFDVIESDDYDDFLADQQAQSVMAPTDPGRALKLVRDAAAYGTANGFPPPADFDDMLRLFGDATPSDETFAFGQEGKPHYVIGPNDSIRFERYVLDTLEARFGPNGYFVTYPVEDDEPEVADD